jgi:hypothetical protein
LTRKAWHGKQLHIVAALHLVIRIINKILSLGRGSWFEKFFCKSVCLTNARICHIHLLIISRCPSLVLLRLLSLSRRSISASASIICGTLKWQISPKADLYINNFLTVAFTLNALHHCSVVPHKHSVHTIHNITHLESEAPLPFFVCNTCFQWLNLNCV